VGVLIVWLGSITPALTQDGCQPLVEFRGEPESGFCSGSVPNCATILGTSITESSQIPLGVLSGIICIEGDFNISTGFSFSFVNATILIAPNVEIVVEAGAILTLNNASLHGCEGLWKGIRLLDNSFILTENNTRIEDAAKAINASHVSAFISIQNTTFNRNYTGIWIADLPSALNPPLIANMYNTNFFCDAPIVGTVKDISNYGIYSLNCPVSFQVGVEQIDHDVNFKGLKYGIKIEGDKPAELIGNRFNFREIFYECIGMSRGSVSLTNSNFINYGDNGIRIIGNRGIYLNNCAFRLNESNPNFFPAPSYPAKWRAGVAFGWDIQDPTFVPDVNIHGKCVFEYNCPGINEIYNGIITGAWGHRFNMIINDNDFRVNGQTATGIHIGGKYTPESTVEILNNRFSISAELPPPYEPFLSYGIRAYSTINNMHIVGNVFTGEGAQTEYPFFVIKEGINISNADGTNNQITDNRFYGDFFSGAWLDNASGWKICSNYAFGVWRVFYFGGDNLSTDFTQNDFVHGGFDIDGTIWAQEQKDNRFYDISPFSTTYARCLQSNCAQISRFHQRQPLGSEFYPTRQQCGTGSPCDPMDEFFKEQSGNGSPVCAEEIQSEDEELLLAIAEGNITDSTAYPAKIWNFKNHLYAKLKRDSILLASHTSFSTFIQNESNTALGKLFLVEQMMYEGLGGTSTGIDTLMLQAAATLNSSITTTATFESNQKTINQILLTSILSQGGEIDTPQVVTLEQIASQCPKEGGPAVVQALTMLTGCNALRVDFYENCNETRLPPIEFSEDTEERMHKDPIQSATGSLKAICTQGVLTVIPPENQTGSIYVFDITGRVCYSGKIGSRPDVIQIDVSNFSAGIYFLNFQGEWSYSAKISITR